MLPGLLAVLFFPSFSQIALFCCTLGRSPEAEQDLTVHFGAIFQTRGLAHFSSKKALPGQTSVLVFSLSNRGIDSCPHLRRLSRFWNSGWHWQRTSWKIAWRISRSFSALPSREVEGGSLNSGMMSTYTHYSSGRQPRCLVHHNDALVITAFIKKCDLQNKRWKGQN